VKLSFVIVSRNKPAQLQRTLRRLAQSPAITLGSEVIVVDDASRARLVPPRELADVPVQSVVLPQRHARAAWDAGLSALSRTCDWAMLLDHRTCPAGDGWIDALLDWPQHVACVMPDIFAIDRESHPRKRLRGGLPCDITRGCVAVRPQLLQSVGGYASGYRSDVAEMHLASRVLRAGLRIVMDPRLLAVRETCGNTPDPRRIVRYSQELLAFVQQFAPVADQHDSLRMARARARAVAARAGNVRLAAAGVRKFRRLRDQLLRDPLPDMVWDELTGLAAARDALSRQLASQDITRIAITDEGPDARIIACALHELGIEIVHETDRPQALVIGSLATGDILSKFFSRTTRLRRAAPRILMPWLPEVPQPLPTSPARAA
jgi:hypothetical protein